MRPMIVNMEVLSLNIVTLAWVVVISLAYHAGVTQAEESTVPIYLDSRNIHHIPMQYPLFLIKETKTFKQEDAATPLTPPHRLSLKLLKNIKLFNLSSPSNKDTDQGGADPIDAKKAHRFPSYLRLLSSKLSPHDQHDQDTRGEDAQHNESNKKDPSKNSEIQTAQESSRLVNFAALPKKSPLRYLFNSHPAHLYPQPVGLPDMPQNYANYLMVPHHASQPPSIQAIIHMQQQQQVAAVVAAAAAAATAASIQRQQKHHLLQPQPATPSVSATNTQTIHSNGPQSVYSNSGSQSGLPHAHSHHYYPITVLSSASPEHESNFYTDQLNIQSSIPNGIISSVGKKSRPSRLIDNHDSEYDIVRVAKLPSRKHVDSNQFGTTTPDPVYYNDLTDAYRTASFVRNAVKEASSSSPTRSRYNSLYQPAVLTTQQSRDTSTQIAAPINNLPSLEHHVNLPYDLEVAGDTYDESA